MRIFLALATAAIAFPAIAGQSCDISCKIEQALRGSGSSALEVAQESRRTQTPDIVAKWLQVAAENGSVAGQWEYANWLVEHSQVRYECIRAAYWFNKASQSGHSKAAGARDRVQTFLASHPKELAGCQAAL
jgi:TPR repeat protein